MGGFFFMGPTYNIISCTSYPMCRCMGFNGKIDITTENFLVNKVNKVLIMDELPSDLIYKLKKCHIGNNMHYTVSEHTPAITSKDYYNQKLDNLVTEREKLF